MAIEDAYDRQRSEVKNSPRTLDVDLIVLGDRRSDDDVLALPHPRARRAGVRAAPVARRRPVGRAARPRPGGRPPRRGGRGRASSGATTSRSSTSERRPRPRRASRPARCGRPRPGSSPRGASSGWSAAGSCTRSPSRCAARRCSSSGSSPPRCCCSRSRSASPPGTPGGPCRCARERLEPHQAVNRLVLGRAAALVGALVAGGYAGLRGQLGRLGRPSWPTSGCSDRPWRPLAGGPDRRRRAAPRACVSRPKGPSGGLVSDSCLPHQSHRPHGGGSAARASPSPSACSCSPRSVSPARLSRSSRRAPPGSSSPAPARSRWSSGPPPPGSPTPSWPTRGARPRWTGPSSPRATRT